MRYILIELKVSTRSGETKEENEIKTCKASNKNTMK